MLSQREEKNLSLDELRHLSCQYLNVMLFRGYCSLLSSQPYDLTLTTNLGLGY